MAYIIPFIPCLKIEGMNQDLIQKPKSPLWITFYVFHHLYFLDKGVPSSCILPSVKQPPLLRPKPIHPGAESYEHTIYVPLLGFPNGHGF